MWPTPAPPSRGTLRQVQPHDDQSAGKIRRSPTNAGRWVSPAPFKFSSSSVRRATGRPIADESPYRRAFSSMNQTALRSTVRPPRRSVGE